MMCQPLIGVLAALFISGCATSGPSVEAYLAQHPEKPTAVRTAMRNGYLVQGMTREDIEVVRGKPVKEWVNPAAEGAEKTVLVYRDRQIEEHVVIQHGKLIEILHQGTPVRTGIEFRF